MTKANLHKLYFVFLFFLAFSMQGTKGIAAEGKKLGPDDIVAICGDSITAGGYVIPIESYLAMCYVNGPVRTVKFGWPGESMGSLWNRKCQLNPILTFKPTIVTVCYGMNDAGYRKVDSNCIRRYINGLTRLVNKVKKEGAKRVIVGSATAVDTTTYPGRNNLTAQGYNKELEKLVTAAKKMAEDEGVEFTDIHHLMLEVMKKSKAEYGEAYHVAGERGVHPKANGNLVLAYAFLKALGCDGNIGHITIDLSEGKAAVTGKHKILNLEGNAVDVESHRYPFCFWGQKDKPNATAGIIDFFPFNNELNRFILSVKGIEPEHRYNVGWGKWKKEFSGKDLLKGINLAAEFMENPFCERFRKVRWIIMDKKGKWETRQYMHILSRLPTIMKNIKSNRKDLKKAERRDVEQILEVDPEAGETMEKLVTAIVKKDEMLQKEVVSLIIPVKHRIIIEKIK